MKKEEKAGEESELKQKKEISKLHSKRKTLLIVLSILIIIILFLFLFTKAYLVIKLLIGNDLVVKLIADKENLFLSHNQSEKINFDVYTTTNAFCTAQCTSEFFDLSSNALIEKESFNLSAAGAKSKSFILRADKSGVGQEIYRFNVTCSSKKTFFCHTTEEPRARNLLITLNYNLTEEEAQFKQESKKKITSLIFGLNNISAEVNALNGPMTALNRTSNITFLFKKIELFKQNISSLNITVSMLKLMWEEQNYSFSLDELDNTEIEISKLLNKTKEINLEVIEDISFNNGLIESLTILNESLEDLKHTNVTNSTSEKINNIILEFNSLKLQFIQQENLTLKKEKINNLSREIVLIYLEINNYSNLTLGYFANTTINFTKPQRINFTSVNYSFIFPEFKELEPEVCLFGECKKFCNESCKNNKEYYPIILLHGHDFNKDISAEYSLNAFNMIQKKLENDSYINAGSLLLSSTNENEKGIWGKMNSPVAITASYYFDLYKNTSKSRVIETKTDNIDSYVLRLKDIVELTKYKTGKDKVIIVAHSMGGLVARRYMQIFGTESIDKLIMVGTPNHGIDGTTLNYCSLFGASAECGDMSKDSLFINKLENSGSPGIPVYNIIGIGCDTAGETGDGIVKSSSAYLNFATNYYINGTCKEIEFDFLHTNFLNTDKYPEVYTLIKEALLK